MTPPAESTLEEEHLTLHSAVCAAVTQLTNIASRNTHLGLDNLDIDELERRLLIVRDKLRQAIPLQVSPCAFCKRNQAGLQLRMGTRGDGEVMPEYQVVCGNAKCQAAGPRRSTGLSAAEAWNTMFDELIVEEDEEAEEEL